MTRLENAKRQRTWQRQRKAANLIAFRWFMAQVMGGEKGLRLIKTGLRKVLKHPDSTPAQILSASKWLLFIETGKRGTQHSEPRELPELQPTTVEQNSVVTHPVISPEDEDRELEALINKLKV